jgi:ribosomal protein L15E
MTYRSSGVDRFRLLARRIVGFLATQRVAVVASRTRRLRQQGSLYRLGHDRAPKMGTKVLTAHRSRP